MPALETTALPLSSLERSLASEIEKLLGRPLDDAGWARLGRAVSMLHARFVSESPLEAGQSNYLTDKEALAGYLAYFFLSSLAQVRRALSEVALPDRSTLRVLDVGSGPGPASLAIAQAAQLLGRKVHVTAIEATPASLQTLKRLWSPSWGTVETVEWRAGQALPAGPFDIVVASHVLNELFLEETSRLDRRAQLALELGKRLSPKGLLLLLEPALKRTARELLVVRDRLIPHGFVALAPCLFQGSCPAITRPRDWCHADRPWPLPRLVDQAGEAAGLSRDTLKFAYVVLSNVHPEPAQTKDAALFRIVSAPLPEKGKLRFFGCGPSGRHALVRLDREAVPSNAAFERFERGDVVRLQGLTASGDGKRVGADSTIDVLASATDRDRDATQ
jgi:ribosomal protein RSM22 (predicted rRNA methylase)